MSINCAYQSEKAVVCAWCNCVITGKASNTTCFEYGGKMTILHNQGCLATYASVNQELPDFVKKHINEHINSKSASKA